MALYAAAFDERIKVTVSSELGIGLSFSNYEDYWYLGEKINSIQPGSDHHVRVARVRTTRDCSDDHRTVTDRFGLTSKGLALLLPAEAFAPERLPSRVSDQPWSRLPA